MAERTPEQEVERARRAEALLSDPQLREAFDAYRARLHDQWHKSPARDAEGREKLFQMTVALDEAEVGLRAMIQMGKAARDKMQQMEDAAKPRMFMPRIGEVLVNGPPNA